MERKKMIFERTSKRTGMCKRLISLFIAQTFIFSNITFAAPQPDNQDISKAQSVVTNPDKIVIPREEGLVKSKFTSNSDKLIIHIQDAHCNYEAQSNIARILECLIKNDGLSLISVEGADGPIDTTWFKAFPDEEVRKEVATYFMKKGEITGPEFLSITTNLPIKLFGAETRSYYIENLNAFTSSYPLKADTEKYFNTIKAALSKLKEYIYSADLRAMDQKSQDYESKKIQFNDYIRFLQDMAERSKINLRSYENLFKLVSVLIYEKKIDFTQTDKERNTLIDELSKKLAKDAITELVAQSMAFKIGKLSSTEYYSYLRSLAMKNDIDVTARFPNLYNYIIYNAVYSRIENEKLFRDIRDVETAIKEKLFKNDDQRTLERLSRHIDTLLGLVNIKLLNGDFDYYKNHKDEFSYEAFTGFITKKSIQYGLRIEIDQPAETVAGSISKLEDFYAIAIKRDKALVDNTLKQMDKDKLKIAVLVTGGFHSEGISRLLEKEGISYLVVCPSITKDVPTPYIQILTNQRTPIEDILTARPEAKRSLLAAISMAEYAPLTGAQARSQLMDAAERTPEIQALVDSIIGRAENFRKGWVNMAIARWMQKALQVAGSNPYARQLDVIREAYLQAMANSLRDTKLAQKRSGLPETEAANAALTAREMTEIKDLVAGISRDEKFTRDFESLHSRMLARAAGVQTPSPQAPSAPGPQNMAAARVRTGAGIPLTVPGRLFMPSVNFAQGQPLDTSLINTTRTAEEVLAILERAARENREISISGHLRGIDGPGSSLDLPEFQKVLTELGVMDLSNIPSTPTIASEFGVKIRFERAKNPNVVEYVAPDYGYTESNPYIVEGAVRLNEYGKTPNKQKDGPAFIFNNIFGLRGIRIICEEVPPLALAGGMESSNVFNVALVTAASVLSGANLSYADIFSLAVKLENDEFSGLTGGQGHLCTMVGGAYRHIWLSGIKDAEGRFVNPYGAYSVQLLSEEQLSKVEEHTFLVQAGKRYKNGEPELGRTASLINWMWTDLLRDRDEVGFVLHREKLGLAAQYTRAIQEGNFGEACAAINRYVDIRDTLCKRWVALALDAHAGKQVPEYAKMYARKVFDKTHPEYKNYDVVRDMYKLHGDNLRNISLYTLEPIKGLMESARAEGIAIMPLGAGGPGSNMVAMSPKGTKHLKDFFESRGINKFTADQAEEAKKLLRGEKAEGEIKGYLPFKTGKEQLKLTGFAELGLAAPQLPEEAQPAAAPPIYPSGGISPAVSPGSEEGGRAETALKQHLDEMKDSFGRTLGFISTSRAAGTIPQDVAVLLVFDDDIDAGVHEVAREAEQVLKANLGESCVATVRASGQDLIDTTRSRISEFERRGMKVAVVANLRSTAANELEAALRGIVNETNSALEGRGRSALLKLDIDDNNPFSMIGLVDVDLRIGFGLNDEQILRSLNTVAVNGRNMPFAIDDLKNILSGALALKPIRRENINSADELRRGEQAALRSM
jgi:hypothetical protein